MQEPTYTEVERLAHLLRTCDGMSRPTVAKHIEELGRIAELPICALLDDPNWGVRYWAAKILQSIGTIEAVPSLEAQAQVETDKFARDAMHQALLRLKPLTHAVRLPALDNSEALVSLPTDDFLPDSFEPSAEDIAFLDRWSEGNTEPEPGLIQIHRRVNSLRSRLRQAHLNGDSEREERLRARLIAAQLSLRQQMSDSRLSPAEIEGLRDFYRNAAAPEKLARRYQNVCWVCLADVDSDTNERCTCKWLICDCGACQCPDFSLGPKGHDPECELQIQRLGEVRYADLVTSRQERHTSARYPNFSFARVDFS